jgi:hypothetical protein
VREAIPRFVRNHNNTVDFGLAYNVCSQLLAIKAAQQLPSETNERQIPEEEPLEED